MTGRMVHVAAGRPAPHVCTPPGNQTVLCDRQTREDVIASDEPADSLWRCSCGRLWEADGEFWHRAGRVTRWRWRKVGRS